MGSARVTRAWLGVPSRQLPRRDAEKPHPDGVCSPRIELQELPGRIYQRISSERVRPKVSKDRWNIADSRSQTCVVLSDDLWEVRDRRREQRHDHVLRPGETRTVWMSFVLPMRDEAGPGTRIFPQQSLPYSRRAKSSGEIWTPSQVTACRPIFASLHQIGLAEGSCICSAPCLSRTANTRNALPKDADASPVPELRPSRRLLSVRQNGDFGGELSVTRINIHGDESPFDQIEKLAGLAIRIHNNSLGRAP